MTNEAFARELVSRLAGVLPAAVAAGAMDLGLICPEPCGAGAACAGGTRVIAPRSLIGLINECRSARTGKHLRGDHRAEILSDASFAFLCVARKTRSGFKPTSVGSRTDRENQFRTHASSLPNTTACSKWTERCCYAVGAPAICRRSVSHVDSSRRLAMVRRSREDQCVACA